MYKLHLKVKNGKASADEYGLMPVHEETIVEFLETGKVSVTLNGTVATLENYKNLLKGEM